jgi:glycosyltransferase involved in cell wall biosynthesis
MEPLISVMTVVYNGEPFVERCYRSLLAQRFADWEWIVVDDGSTDGTRSALEAIRNREPRMRLIRYQPNRGRGYARTIALEKARGSWVAVWDVDDLYFAHHLGRIDHARRGGFDYYGSTSVVLDRKLRYLGIRGWGYPLPPTDVRAGCHAAMGMRLDLARRIGYQPDLRTVGQVAEDARICLILPTHYRGLLDDEPSFANVIGHEVFLRKSIDANTTRMACMRDLFERGELPLTREQFERLRDADRRKLRMLKSLWLCPPLYKLIMSFRPRGRLLPDRRLSEEQEAFLATFRRPARRPATRRECHELVVDVMASDPVPPR